MTPITIALILVCVAFNTIAQVLLKAGTKAVGAIDLSTGHAWQTATSLVFEWHIFTGLVCYVASVAVWLLVLSRTEVSIAYPMSSLGYVATAVAAWYLFGEPMTAMRVAGIIVIIAGVYLVARS
jgi:multidrug transporter EmrE-like cation transporter